MNGVMKYQQSIASEFSAIKDRVRFFINDKHWGEDGRYKEVILMDYLRRILPSDVSVGTGFVKNKIGELTGQIDIIVYKSSAPRLFSEGDFVILMPESILGIIEVKSKSTHSTLSNTNSGFSVIQKAEENGRMIGNTNIFNGNPLGDGRRCYSAYRLSYKNVTGIKDGEKPGFAFGYFISNLLEAVYSQIAPEVLSGQHFEFLYPLEGTKERYKVKVCEVYLED